MKRLFDLIVSIMILIVISPILIIFCILIFLQDFKSPLYLAQRMGRDEKIFTMIKLRSMVVNADKTGVDSTANNDTRITTVGALVRKFKIDELAQLLNVVKGDMSLVGPRPNVKRETDLYTTQEKRLLTIRPGITDISSIVFSDEGDILDGSKDPDLDYNQKIRPGKGYLGLFYVDNKSLLMDINIMYLTALAIISKKSALNSVVSLLKKSSADDMIIDLASRRAPLVPMPPPGASKIVTDRDSVPS